MSGERAAALADRGAAGVAPLGLGPSAADAPDPCATIARLRRETDWAAVLPDRARSLSWLAQQRVKRLMDILASVGGLLVLSPLLVLVAALVKLTSPGPILFRWKVLGERARPFVGYKFRTMVADAEQRKAEFLHYNEMTGPVFKMRNDPRVTRLGRWLRKLSVDELPQLWSVLKGEMSLVGPRPPSAEEFMGFAPWQRGKLAVRPGLTCLWQVSGRSEIVDFEEWMRLDLRYIEEWNLWLDVKILLRTIPVVLRGHGAY